MSTPGMAGLNHEHLFTVEALAEYLLHLKERGILIISRKLHLPPSDSLKFYAAAFQVRKSRDVERPEGHIMILRRWDSYTLLISPSPFSAGVIAGVKEFCLNLYFDLVHYPGIQGEEANLFNVFDEPYHFESVEQLSESLAAGKQGQTPSYPESSTPVYFYLICPCTGLICPGWCSILERISCCNRPHAIHYQ